MAIGAAGGTTINRVRLLRAGRDPLAARLSADRILAEAAHAPALPPAAILCVKRLRDPLPGSIRLASAQPAPHRWTQAVDAALSGLARRAVRPARDAIAGEPEAVIFDDRAQMLACLAADWCSGTAAARWWWRALVGDGAEIQAVLRAWRERPEHIAAAIEELTLIGSAARFVRQLSRDDTRLLLDEVLASHGLAQLATAIGIATSQTEAGSHPPGAPPTRAAGTVSDERALEAGRPRAPWAHVAPDAHDPMLAPDQELLLGVALTLRRRPVVARSARFAAAARAWRAEANDAVMGHAGDAVVAAPHRTERTTSEAPVAVAPGQPSRDPPARETRVPTRAHPALSQAFAGPLIPASEAPAPPDDASRAFDGTRQAVVHTEIGGLFYLLNVAIALGYYGDFTAPAHRNLEVSIWDFVTVVGRVLLPDEDADPIWALLAALAGREPDEPPDARASRRIRRLVPAVRARLGAALGTRDRAVLANLVCRHAARILIAPAHLDVIFSLADLPIAIRLSGLDRDPGWIPAADRIVTFHFE